jgi:hypothetical protein
VKFDRDLALALDPVRLFELPGRIADPWQAKVLRSRSLRQLLLCARQTGKSVTAGALAAHEAVYVPGSLVLILSPSLRQSGELFRKCLDVYQLVAEDAPPKDESALRLELKNGSRIISLPGAEETIRGYSGVTLLVLDEASRIPDELVTAVRPMLAVSNGRLIALTTPWGKRGWFYQAWAEGSGEWEPTEVLAKDCPRISADFLAKERRAIGKRAFSQEYCCKFVDTEDAYFSGADIERMVDPEVSPLFPTLPRGDNEDDVPFAFDPGIKVLEMS